MINKIGNRDQSDASGIPYADCPHLLIMNNGPTSSWSLEVETHPTFSCIQSLFVRAPETDSHAAARGTLWRKLKCFKCQLAKGKASPHFNSTSILSLCLIQLVVVLSLSSMSFYSLF